MFRFNDFCHGDGHVCVYGDDVMRAYYLEEDEESFGSCACGCKELITSSFSYYKWEDEYFSDIMCVLRYMKEKMGLEEIG
jgi:hypothetical protein